MSWNQYPGGGHHNQAPQPPNWGGQPQHGYGHPPPPPFPGGGGGYGAPFPPPPPQNWNNEPGYGGGGYAPPPPPPQQQQGYHSGGGYDSGGGYNVPTGAPPQPVYAQTGAGYNPNDTYQRASHPPGGVPHRPPTQQQHYGPQMQGQGGVQQPYFQYSQCNGKKKALCIGINYIGTSSALAGCINDAHNVQKFLIDRYGYKSQDMVMLTDDAQNPRQIPTRANMLQAMRWLVQGAQPNDSLFFHYSGHGGQTKDLDGDEDDGNDEVIYPLDFKQAGHIVDDESDHDVLVKPLPAGCRLTMIFDSCHSGTASDMPYVYSTEGVIKEPNLLADAGQGLLNSGMSYLRGDTSGMLKGLMGIGKSVMGSNSSAKERSRQTKTSPADCIQFSGCKDDQTSADTQVASVATGAMSYAFIAALTKYPEQSYKQLLNSIRDELRSKYSQKPQLSASHPIDTNLLFIC